MAIDTQNKLAGILVPAFALRSDSDLGIGDTNAVKEAIDFCHRYSLSVLQLLPINETGGDNSPYNALSSIALDPALINFSPSVLDTVPGLKPEHWQSLQATEAYSASKASVIDYVVVKRDKQLLLRKAFAQFLSDSTKFKILHEEFENFRAENKHWLSDYTIFRSLVSRKQGNTQWTEWEDDLKNVDSARLLIAQDKQLQQDSLFYAYVQWIAHRQWSDVKEYADKHNVRLVGDIPFGVSRYSADVWAHRDLFDLEWSGGAPPEKFFQSDSFTATWGQNWGIPLYNWQVHERENYAWWRCRVKQVVKYFHGFRIDHVLGFFRIYAFPWNPEKNQIFADLNVQQAAELTKGQLPQFMPRSDEKEEEAHLNCQDGEKRLKVILEAAGSAFVIAEDLGMVPPYVRPALKKLGIPGFAIPIFERDESDRSFLPASKLPVLSLATYGTHDNEPLVSYYESLVKWWHGEDGHAGWLEIQRLMHFLRLDENNPPQVFNSELLYAFFRALLHSPCWLTVLMITDLLGTKQRFNLPGTSSDSNWSQRMDKSLSEYSEDPFYAEKFNYIKQLILETRRRPNIYNKMEPSEIGSRKISSAELPA